MLRFCPAWAKNERKTYAANVNQTVNFQVFDRKRTRNENEEEREKRKRLFLAQCYLLLGVMIVQVIVTSYYFKMNGFTVRTKIKRSIRVSFDGDLLLDSKWLVLRTP